MSGPAKAACITLDAVEQSLLRTWAKQGLLPHLGKLLEESVSSETRYPEIIYSGTLWESFNTGVWPGRHDHYYYLQPDSGSYGLRLFMPEDVSVDSIWNTIARQGHRVALIDLPKSRLEHLPQTLQVSFWGEHEVLQPFTCWPPSLEQEVVQIAGKDPVGACDLVRQRPDELRRLKDGLLLERGHWDLFVFNFSEAHCAGHQLWAAREYKSELRSALGEDPLLDVYQAIDRSLGRIVDALGREAFLLVLATHGIGPRYDAAPALDAVLRRLDGIAAPTISGPVEAVRKVWLQIPGVVRRPFRHVIDRLYDASRKAERPNDVSSSFPPPTTAAGSV